MQQNKVKPIVYALEELNRINPIAWNKIRQIACVLEMKENKCNYFCFANKMT